MDLYLFSVSIILKVNVITRPDYNVTVQHVSHKTTSTPSICVMITK